MFASPAETFFDTEIYDDDSPSRDDDNDERDMEGEVDPGLRTRRPSLKIFNPKP
jgi:hypothetical protein